MNRRTAGQYGDVVWQDNRQSIILSPSQGGRITSWTFAGQERSGELLRLEGGLLRFLFGEERYPGSSYLFPHEVLRYESQPGGFRVRLRHYWNTPNALMRAFGWPQKANVQHLDGLILDKEVLFDASLSCILIGVQVQNVTDETKYLTPWLHNALGRWATDMFMVSGGQQVPYHEEDIYWGCHLVKEGQPLRGVLSDAQQKTFAVLGAAPGPLAGMYLAPAQPDVPPELFSQSNLELRYKSVVLEPGQKWCDTAFIALCSDWRRWALESPPVPEDFLASESQPTWHVSSLFAALGVWALPEERTHGLVVQSYLDKAPFSFGQRYHANNSFAGFVAEGCSARAHVVMVALKPDFALKATLEGGAHWRIALDGGQTGRAFSLTLDEFTPRRLHLVGPDDLHGSDAVRVKLVSNGGALAELRVAPGARVEPHYPYQLKMVPEYLEERWATLTKDFPKTSLGDFQRWQRDLRAQFLAWIDRNCTARCSTEHRIVERQVGPTCVREKVLIQTEPGVWIPAYVITPKTAPPTMPALIFYHGSGPGKQMFASDEVADVRRVELAHELEFLPYRLAHELNCLVLVPDLRGWGEVAESNPGQYPERCLALGIDPSALQHRDHMCEVDYLCSRPDVDASQIGAFGSSGGGVATVFVASVDERVGACIVSSTTAYYCEDLPGGFFHRMSHSLPGTGLAPGWPAPHSHEAMLIAPRPLWIMDGWLDSAPESRDEFHRAADAARREIASAYEFLGVPERFRATWEDGGHCAGMTFQNVAAWFRQWLHL